MLVKPTFSSTMVSEVEQLAVDVGHPESADPRIHLVLSIPCTDVHLMSSSQLDGFVKLQNTLIQALTRTWNASEDFTLHWVEGEGRVHLLARKEGDFVPNDQVYTYIENARAIIPLVSVNMEHGVIVHTQMKADNEASRAIMKAFG